MKIVTFRRQKKKSKNLKINLSIENFQKASIVLFTMLFAFLIYSFYLVTIINIAILVLGLIFQFIYRGRVKVQWWPLSLMMLGFVPFLYGMFTSIETDRALIEIQHTLAYLSIPLGVILLPGLEAKQRNNLFGIFAIIISLSTLPVFANYFLDFEVITKSLGEGRAIPTPIDHVRYSIFIAVICVFSFILFIRDASFFGRFGKYFYLALALYLFFSLHLLAVRSGIALAYVGLALSGTLLLFKARKFGLIVLLLVGVAVSPVLAYFAIPSFQNKIKYTRYDLSLSQAGQGANYSDSERIRSVKLGLDIWKDYKLIGIGSGDLKREAGKRYSEMYTEGGRAFLPHNQFVKFLAASGVVGLLCFLISVYGPFFWSKNFSDPFVLSLIGLFTVSFMVEATLERSYMLVFYLLMASLLYKRTIDQKSSL